MKESWGDGVKARLLGGIRNLLTPLCLSLVAVVVRVLYIAAYKDLPSAMAPTGDSQHLMQLAHILWSGHLPPDGFYTAPGYPLLLALHYLVAGSDNVAILRTSQVVASSLVPSLVFITARRVGASWVASCGSGMLVALSGPAIVYASEVLPVTYAMFVASLFMALLVYALSQGRSAGTRVYVICGLMCGLLVSLRGNAIVAAVAVVPILWRAHKGAATAFGGGVLLMLAGMSALSSVSSRQLVVISQNGADNFLIGNGPSADGSFRPVRGVNVWEQRLSRMSTPSHGKLALVAASARSNPSSFALLQLRKVRLLLGNQEIPLNVNYDFLRTKLDILQLPWASFGWLVAPALVGVVAGVGRSPAAKLVIALCAGYAASMVAFFVVSEYRIVMMPWIAVLAAVGIDQVRSLLRGMCHQRRRVFAALWGGLLLTLMPCYQPSFAIASYNYGLSALAVGDQVTALASFREALEMQPGFQAARTMVARLESAAPLRSSALNE